jgi:MoaA/NifB/PqqE/SkfB family radical SAM enzyme
MELPKSKREFFVRSLQFAQRLPFLYHSFSKDTPIGVFPLSVDVNVTDRCNFKCLMCRGADPDYEPKPDMSIEVMRTIIDDMRKMHIPYLTLTGGEPTLRFNFILETLRYARENGITVGMVNNGSLLNERKIVALAEAGLHRLAFSLDGATEETHDRIRMRGSYAKIMANLAICKRLRQEKGYRFRLHVNTVVMGPNVGQLVKIAEIARGFGATVLFQPVDVPQVDQQAGSDPRLASSINALLVGERELAILENEIEQLLELQKRDAVVGNLTWQLRNILRYYRRLASVSDTFRFKCYAGYNTIHVDSDGKFNSCFFMSPVGDVHSTRLIDAWNSPAYTTHRTAIRKCKRPCSLNCYYPMSFGMLAYNFCYLPVRRWVVNQLRYFNPQQVDAVANQARK